jgi:ferrous iron transport protein B
MRTAAVLGTFVLFLFDKLHLLAAIEHVASPIVTRFLGLPQKATQAFIMGFLRRDYGAAGINALFEQDMLTIAQTLVSLVVITLFVPCIANVFVIIKEQGLAKAAAIVSFVFAYAIVAGGVFNFVLHLVHFGT